MPASEPKETLDFALEAVFSQSKIRTNNSVMSKMPSDTSYPVLESKRLRIDRLTTADACDLHQYRSMPEVARFQSWAPASVKSAEEFISSASAVQFDQPGTWFQLALRDSATGSLVGDIGLHFLDGAGYQVEVGITVSPTRQNQGVASEALETLLDYLFFNLNKHRVVASVDPRNNASIRLFQKAGFRTEGQLKQSLFINGEWVDDVLFGILRSEWESIRK